DVRVDEGAAAESAGDDAAEAPERPDVPDAVHALARVPEVPCGLPRAARKGARRVRLAPLEQTDRPSGPGQPVRPHGAAEARSDDDDVEVLLRFRLFPPRHWSARILGQPSDVVQRWACVPLCTRAQPGP